MQWKLIGCLYWLFWAISFGIWEVYAGLSKNRIPMLTQVVVRYVPWPVTVGLLCWGLYHFSVRYANHSYVEWLKTGALK